MDIDQSTLSEDIAVPEVEVNEERSMQDTIRDTLKNIQERESKNGTDIAAKLEEESKPSKPRAPDGKFAKAEAEVKQPAETTAPTTEAPVEQPITEADPSLKPPDALKGSIKAKWATIDPDVRQEIIRRETDMYKGLEQYKTNLKQYESAAQYANALNKEITPYHQVIQQQGLSVDKAIGGLLRTDSILRYGTPDQKIALFGKMAKEYGIDVSQGLPEAPQVDPHYQTLHQQLQMTQQQIAQMAQQQQAERQQQIQAQKAREEQDLTEIIEKAKVGREHFEEVRDYMAALLRDGVVKDLPEAYDQAIWARPDLRQKLLAKQQEEALAKKIEIAQEAKKAASVNVGQRGTFPPAKPVLSMQDDIRETFRRLKGGG